MGGSLCGFISGFTGLMKLGAEVERWRGDGGQLGIADCLEQLGCPRGLSKQGRWVGEGKLTCMV